MSDWDGFEIRLSEDQAVLAEVIRRCEAEGHKIGRTALQKIPYFLKSRGVPLDYSFDLYHYGPFCQDILYEARLLESLDVIVDSRDGYNGGSRYGAGDAMEEQLAEHSDFLLEHSQVIDEVVKLLAPLDASTLEVVATIDYLYRYVAASGKTAPCKPEVMDRFMDAKPQYKSKKQMVSDLYDRMAAIGMVGV